MTCLLHNMSVPPLSQLTVARTRLAGERFVVDLTASLGCRRRAAPVSWIEEELRCHGARAALVLLPRSGSRAPRTRLTRAAFLERLERTAGREESARKLERRLERALASAPWPAGRIGVFVESEEDTALPALPAAQCLAALARRSGPLYLPARAFEPSLVRDQRLVLFFPEP